VPTAAGIIIGDEILTGKFPDENGPFLVRRLRTLGTDLRRLVTIPDDPAVIAAEVRSAAEAFDHVFTSGGVGPTHDDLTLESVARGFGVDTHRHPDLVRILQAADLTGEHAMRMATVPRGTELLWEGAASYPVIRVRNVFVLPGIPRLFQQKFEQVAYRVAGEAVGTRRLYCAEAETSIAARLDGVQRAFPGVDIGSYPRFGEGPWKVIVTLESRDADALAAAAAALEGCLSLVSAPPRTGSSG
jgi:molybdenum cofactor synthesis domain-containing protein